MPDLVVVFLVVSCLSLVLQVLAFIRIAVQQAGNPAERLVGSGYLRTVGCRVLAAVVYVVVAAVQLAGDGALTGEAVIVFTSIQSLWVTNSLLDIVTWGRLRSGTSDGGGNAL